MKKKIILTNALIKLGQADILSSEPNNLNDSPELRSLSPSIEKLLNHNKISLYECVNKDVDRCPICLELFTKDQDLVKLECSHIYCCECIKTSLRIKNQCPLCKSQVTTI